MLEMKNDKLKREESLTTKENNERKRENTYKKNKNFKCFIILW